MMSAEILLVSADDQTAKNLNGSAPSARLLGGGGGVLITIWEGDPNLVMVGVTWTTG